MTKSQVHPEDAGDGSKLHSKKRMSMFQQNIKATALANDLENGPKNGTISRSQELRQRERAAWKLPPGARNAKKLELLMKLNYLPNQDPSQQVPTDDINRLSELYFDCWHLAHECPIEWKSDKKSNLFKKIIAPDGPEEYVGCRLLNVVRLRSLNLPVTLPDDRINTNVPSDLDIRIKDDYYQYEKIVPEEGCMEWYVNFSDQVLFNYCETDFVKDTVSGTTTRTHNIYGDNFQQTPTFVLEQAVKRLHPERFYTNLISMTAIDQLANPLKPKKGPYQIYELRHIFRTAYTAFSGAVRKAKELGYSRVVIHTGDWGCGEFGGNVTVMAFLQMAAAKAAGATRLYYHKVNGDPNEVEQAIEILKDVWPAEKGRINTDLLLKTIKEAKTIGGKGLEWALPRTDQELEPY
ncbi:hypothetical protein HDU96_001757 [Phlyctochytrium bullatum]|nr:hypothetical protein HDU96_001757 [Phlyctochytrium bullatum]